MKRRLFVFLFALLSLSQVARAEEVAIGSVSDWQAFAARVNAGENELDAYLTQDVDLGDDQTMVGTSEYRYRGRFNGRGHTLTIHYIATEDVCAPFRYTTAMKITALHVAGTINTAYKYAGGIVGNTSADDGRINNCRSSVVINSSVNGLGGHGGFVADEDYNNIYITNCLFDGSIQTTDGTTDCGGLIGYHCRYVYMYNCLYAPSAEGVNSGGTFAYPTTPDWINIYNSYYTSTMGTVQGTSAAGMSAEELAKKLGGMWEVVDGKPVPIMSQRPLSGNGTEASPYTISSVTDWQNFCSNINNGESYSGKYVAMTQDVDLGDLQIMAGMPELVLSGDYLMLFSFKGIFDGKNHTLTVNYKSTESYCAPFKFIEAATIKNLHTAGTIETGHQFCGGVVAGIRGNNTSSTIENCRSSIVLTSSVNGDGTHGGIVGTQIGSGVTINIKNCLFDGKMLTTNGTTNCGGILGYVGWRGSIENSAYIPQTPAEGETPITAGSNTIGRYYVDNNQRLTLTNCYYGAKMETLQGDPIARSITGDEGISVTIPDQQKVTVCGESFYPSGTMVELAYSGTEPFNHYEVNNGAISNVFTPGGSHTLTDIYGDVIIFMSTEEIEREMYISYDGQVATYYYDNQRASHAYTSDPNRRENGCPVPPDGVESPNKVVIDPSMADARPVMETGGMFFFGVISSSDKYYVQEIEGLEYLNTSESVNMEGMFNYCRVKSLDLSHFDTRKVTNMQLMFNHCTELKDVEFGDNFNTENVTNMWVMFNNCSKLENLDLSSFNTAKVTDMGEMFANCSNLKNLDLSSFNTTLVTDMHEMFANCGNLTTVVVGSGWTVANVTSGKGIIDYCESLVGGKGSSMQTYGVRPSGLTYCHIDGGTEDPGYFWSIDDMTRQTYAAYDSSNETLYFCNDYWKGKRGSTTTCYDLPTTRGITPWYEKHENVKVVKFMLDFADARPVTTFEWFDDMTSLQTIEGIEYLNTSEVTDMSGMFFSCEALQSIDFSHFDTRKVKDMSTMFSNCEQLKELDLSSFNTGSVTNMRAMFSDCSNLKSLDVSSFNTVNVTNMYRMFDGCKKLEELDVCRFNTAKVDTLEMMFQDCASLKAIDVSGFNTANSTRMQKMFSGCSSVTELDVSGFNTAKAIWMNHMFYGCSSLTELDVSGFNTGACRNLSYMFQNCKKLTEIDVSNFNTSNVTTLANMFYGCSSITEIDLGSFETSNVTSMGSMFYGCSNLKTIYASEEFVTTKVNTQYGGTDMFKGCTSIVGGNGTPYQGDSFETHSYARIDGVDNKKGYFTDFDSKSYAVYDETTHTLSFYGDNKRDEHTDGTILSLSDIYNGGTDHHQAWERVVFDTSFAKSKPKAVAAWFADCTSLKEIVGMENLNLAKVTDVGYLFYNCSALDLLDLSKLDLSKAEIKYYMFVGLNPDCVLYLPSGTKASDFEGEGLTVGGLEHPAYNLVLDEDGDGQYTCADLRLKDGKDYLYPIVTPFHADKVTYQRTFTGGVRATVYLPFAFDATLFGKIYDYDGQLTGTAIRFYPVSAPTTTANTPYIIDPNGTQIEAQNVDVVATCDTKPTGANEMIGVCRRGVVPVGAYCFDATNGTLKRVTANSGVVYISAFRAYFLLPSIDAADSKVIETFFDDTPTAITIPDAVTTEEEWYTVNGQRLPGRPNKKGIYIVNGRKYVVK
ncbi:MAG: BspA family leucine-rich repeat surface protein [Prevotella sp.]|nr:BspA family leucine-rich repeat surface protein [Prevotella sp.]